MGTIDALKNIFQTIVRTSILMGALFFCTHNLHAAISDSTTSNDTNTFSQIDTLKVEETERFERDSIQNAIQEERISHPDTVYTPAEKEVKGMFADHSPHKATIYSAVLPGLGQAYNRKYWKIPIIYFVGYWFYYGLPFLEFMDLNLEKWGIRYYHRNYLDYKKLYYEESYNPEGDSGYEDLYRKNMNLARKARDRIVIFMGILYVANIVDAMADAHFYYFDISDDLSMKVLPSITAPDSYLSYNDYSLGVKLCFKF